MPVEILPAAQQPVTNALLAMLRSVLSGKMPVGDGEAPKPAAGKGTPAMPYAVLYAVPGGDVTGGQLGDESSTDGVWAYQVTCVGAIREQAEAALDAVRAAVLSRTSHAYTHPITSTAVNVHHREHRSFGPTRPEAGLWNAVEFFTLYSTPV